MPEVLWQFQFASQQNKLNAAPGRHFCYVRRTMTYDALEIFDATPDYR